MAVASVAASLAAKAANPAAEAMERDTCKCTQLLLSLFLLSV